MSEFLSLHDFQKTHTQLRLTNQLISSRKKKYIHFIYSYYVHRSVYSGFLGDFLYLNLVMHKKMFFFSNKVKGTHHTRYGIFCLKDFLFSCAWCHIKYDLLSEFQGNFLISIKYLINSCIIRDQTPVTEINMDSK